ncbi:Hyoscyamine 6-dioxygenase [Actinidia chinensis var. chinensis]|uniref:Hyoscyamine 6-dioxygenase n=1 Tax=Actinidia chinensis var. chinensis TaxID=1590841 RepID=A0A2R6QJ45_ACTCC|nr:Hyoscyamine 6-dioxygenase [Actinidia chinensis var. chinensis]
MAKLVSSWSKDIKSLPENYVFPPDQRPKELVAPLYNPPIVDLTKSADEARQKILEAGRDFGFFQVMNHGISQSLINEAMDVLKEFFDMPAEVKASAFTADSSKRCRLYTSTFQYDTEEVHFWRDNLTHPCHPLEDCLQLWPEKPTRYRDIVGKYSVEVRKLVLKILDLICEGLELEQGYFGDELSRIHLLSVNHYPRCPDPSLAMGMQRHCDPNVVTILFQGDTNGLHVFSDGKWIGVEPIPNAFIVIIGCQLQIISNNKLKSAEHRVVTNSEVDRTTIGYFVIPSYECFVEPAKTLVDEHNPAIYKACQYKEFLSTYANENGKYETLMEFYKLQT